MYAIYMVTFTINMPQMLAYIPAPWILWGWIYNMFIPPFNDYDAIWPENNVYAEINGSILQVVGLMEMVARQKTSATGWWFGTWILFFHIVGMSSSQLLLTPSFFRGVGGNHQPTMENPHSSHGKSTISTGPLLMVKSQFLMGKSTINIGHFQQLFL